MLDKSDQIAVALVPLKTGQDVRIRTDCGDQLLRISEDIPRYHKFALVDLASDTIIRKGGDVIGRLFVDVAAGKHVHTQNLVGAAKKGALKPRLLGGQGVDSAPKSSP